MVLGILGWFLKNLQKIAHQTAAMIGSEIKATGKVLIVVNWRANRLADAIAKAFARDHLAPDEMVTLVASARKAVSHHAALLGRVTHNANNCPTAAVRKDGTPYQKFCRDSSDDPSGKEKGSNGQRTAKEIKNDEPQPPSVAPPCETSSSSACHKPALPFTARHEPDALLAKRRILSERRKERVAEEQRLVIRRVAEIGSTLKSRQHSPTGESRLEALQRRVRSRLR